uniref:Secreted protein n=1 Tax=Salix viminalis TaxID=40686 RepID=A0A6N2LX44_SALVM
MGVCIFLLKLALVFRISSLTYFVGSVHKKLRIRITSGYFIVHQIVEYLGLYSEACIGYIGKFGAAFEYNIQSLHWSV